MGVYVPCSTMRHAGRADDTLPDTALRRLQHCGGGHRIRVNKSVSTRRVHLAIPCPSSDTETTLPPPPPPRRQNYHTSPHPARTHAPFPPHAMSTTHITTHNTISSDTTTSFIAGYAPRPYASRRIMRRIYRRALWRREDGKNGESV